MLKQMLFTGLLLSVSPALAQTQSAPAPGPANAAPAKKDAGDRIICETEAQIGSRLASKRVCMTASQWKERQQQIHDQLDQTHVNVESQAGPG